MDSQAQRLIDETTQVFLDLHRSKESLFWDTRMGTSDAQDELTRANLAVTGFLSSSERLARFRRLRATDSLSEEQARIVHAWIRLFEANSVFNTGTDVQGRLLELEETLERTAEEGSGYVDPHTGAFSPANSVALRNIVSVDPDEARRRAAWNGLCGIAKRTVHSGLPEIYRLRNRLAREGGFPDYYAMRLSQMGEMPTEELFDLFDEVEGRTRRAAERALTGMARLNSVRDIAPWNVDFYRAGSVTAEEDPYFRFDSALERWISTFGALGISYRGATVTVDLLNRKGKHPNGFMHGPGLAWRKEGSWCPARINFTSTCMPREIGHGQMALGVLMHEGGHAAHFSNMDVPTPALSSEFPPSSVGFVEMQSMFLDRLLEDADWRMRYARDERGESMPFELVERGIRLKQPYAVFTIRWLIAVAAAEHRIYALPDEEITPERMTGICEETERRFLGHPAPRPILSITHVRSHESSAYYHGYALAELGLRQTRDFFLKRDGHLVDNPRVGPDLARHYWRNGNECSGNDCMRSLMGCGLSADALVRFVTRTPDEAVRDAREAISRMEEIPTFGEDGDLGINLRVVHGAQEIVPVGMPLPDAVRIFRNWIRADHF